MDIGIPLTIGNPAMVGHSPIRGGGRGHAAAPPVTPVITGLTPPYGGGGDTITIDGSGFGGTQGTGSVTFGGIPATIVSWSDTQIVVTVPNGDTTGNVVITNNSGLSDTEPFVNIYLLRDLFTTPAADPIASPRTCEPGPGTLTVTAIGGDVSIGADGRLVFGSAANTYNDPKLQSVLLTRADVGALSSLWRMYGAMSYPLMVLNANETPADPLAVGQGIYWNNYNFEVPTSKVIITSLRVRSIDYLIAILVRPTAGTIVAISGGAYGTFPTGTVLWVYDTVASNVYAHLAVKDANLYVDHMSVLKVASLPAGLAGQYSAALAADTFTRADNAALGSTEVGSLAWSESGTGSITSSKLRLASYGANAKITPAAQPRIIQVSATLPSPAGDCASGISFRDNGANYLIASFGNAATTLYSYDGSYHILQQTGAVVVSKGATHTLTVLDLNTSVKLFIDGVLAIDQATALYNGQVGVGLWNFDYLITENHDFDNFQIYGAITLPTTLGPFPTPPVGSGAAVKSYDFAAANGTSLDVYSADWTEVTNAWEISSNKARITAAAQTGYATIESGLTDCEVSADITLPADPGANDWFCGLLVRYTDANNYIYARYLYQANSPEIEIWQFVGGVSSLTGFVNFGGGNLAAGSTHTMKLAVKGNETAAYQDGELVCQGYTTLATGTRVGMGCDGTSGQPTWDNFAVKAT